MKAKKSLGQNWLTSESARAEIIAAAELSAAETVLEIGPGQGFLTEALLASGATVLAVEKDDRLIGELQKLFAPELASGQLTLTHADILDLEPGEGELAPLKAGKWKLVANIPYYITGQLLQKFLTAENQPDRMVVMLQKQVAERIVARDGKESILSLSVKAYGEPKYVKMVPKGAFSPQPSVDSAILLIKNISRDRFKQSQVSEARFFELVKRGFAHKRKLLRRNLAVEPEILAKCSLNPDIRAEDVTIEEWLCLCTAF
jgi:16S rRNA (adenine1518-N6/adenine1519-N6)-dimethyltransferase